MENNTKEITVGAVLAILLFMLVNPGDLFMPSMNQTMLLAGAAVAFAIFATLLWRERGGDERDQLHRLVADRIAFWVTSIVLMLALIVQGSTAMVDPWLAAALGALVLGKVAGIIYSKNKL